MNKLYKKATEKIRNKTRKKQSNYTKITHTRTHKRNIGETNEKNGFRFQRFDCRCCIGSSMSIQTYDNDVSG